MIDDRETRNVYLFYHPCASCSIDNQGDCGIVECRHLDHQISLSQSFYIIYMIDLDDPKMISNLKSQLWLKLLCVFQCLIHSCPCRAICSQPFQTLLGGLLPHQDPLRFVPYEACLNSMVQPAQDEVPKPFHIE